MNTGEEFIKFVDKTFYDWFDNDNSGCEWKQHVMDMLDYEMEAEILPYLGFEISNDPMERWEKYACVTCGIRRDWWPLDFIEEYCSRKCENQARNDNEPNPHAEERLNIVTDW
jgi:hypothetical protein